MPNIPLSVGALKQLERQLNRLAKDLPDDIATMVNVAAAEEAAKVVRRNVATISNLDGNYDGGENPEATVVVRVGYKGRSQSVVWQGSQIAYLEFGTGAAGASNPYQGIAIGATGYTPDPTKDEWAYLDTKSGKAEISHGIPPYAPMYNASVEMRVSGNYDKARQTWKKVVRDAITV